jgi:hypothetical protein
MAEAIQQVDPDFVKALQTNITGMYFRQVEHYTPAEIEREFRKAVTDPALLEDEEFAGNLMYLVRKKEVKNLREDVWRLVAGRRMKPAAQVSGLKTLYALGGEGERLAADGMEAEALAQLIQSGQPPEGSPYVEAADGIGGARTLVALRRLHQEAANRQAVAEQRSPGEFARISQLDKTRAGLARQIATLTRKQEVAAKPEPERTAGLARIYLSRAPDLSCWAFRELLATTAPGALEAVNGVVANELPHFLPIGGQSPEDRAKAELDLKLRGIALLERMGSRLSPEQSQLLQEHILMIQERRPFFYPRCDWTDVLDRT